ncbi:hypothetical protein [Xylanimonas sp. McL0601]|uniref:hypothetical protein n=1 Tax=Xylanimonas sp. McL0601 TaxID=3414739 RepID=UPI003CF1D683
MNTATRVLGELVPSSNPAFLAVLAVHVVAGLTAVVTGATTALSRKGGARHVRFGRRYYWAIGVVFVTATALAAMRWRQSAYLFVIGAAAFSAATIGYLHRRRHRPGHTGHIVGMGVSFVLLLTAFYVDNGPRLPLLEHLPVLVFWLAPSAIGAPLIARGVVRYRQSGAAGVLAHDDGEGHALALGDPRRRPP